MGLSATVGTGPRLLGWLAAIAVTLCVTACPALAQGPDLAPCVPDGPVQAITHAGGNTYIGGQFGAVGQRSGSGMALAQAGVGSGGPSPCQAANDPESAGGAPTAGQPLRPFPEVAGGSVYATVADGSGGWYIGGTFTTVGDQPRDGLAHIGADGSVRPGMGDPNAPGGGNGIECSSGCTPAVYALALDPSGSYLYVGGAFDGIGSPGNVTTPSSNLAAINAGDGTAVTDPDLWTPPSPNDTVNAVATVPVTIDVSLDGGTSWKPTQLSIVVVGGAFNTLGPTTGASAKFTGLGAVWGVGATQSCVAQSPPTPCSPGTPGTPVEMGGALVQAGPGATPSKPWDPAAAFTPSGTTTSDVRAVAVGQPVEADGAGGNPASACTSTTTNCVDYLPIYAAGTPSSGQAPVQAFQLPLVAKIGKFSSSLPGETLSGAPKYTWDLEQPLGGPPAGSGSDGEEYVSTLALSPRPDLADPIQAGSSAYPPNQPNVYIGGDFTFQPTSGSAAGEWSNLAAVVGIGDASQPTQAPNVIPWAPTGANGPLNAPVRALAVRSGSPDTIYAGGSFTDACPADPVPGTCDYAAAFVGANGQQTTPLAGWTPALAGGEVDALALSDPSAATPSVYTGGSFESTGAVARHNLAALDGAGSLLPWNPGAASSGPSSSCGNGGSTPQVSALAASGTTIYAGGVFDTAGGSQQCNLAALDASSGQPVSAFVPPNANGPVLALAYTGNALYAGGRYTQIGGQSRTGLAKVDPGTGAVDASWNPGPTASGGSAGPTVDAVSAGCTAVYVGGDFAAVGGKPRSDLAALDPASGTATGWNPGATSYVNAIEPAGTRVYVAGNFPAAGSGGGPYVAAIDASTGKASTSFYPAAHYTLRALALAGSTLYEGQTFGGPGGTGGVQNLIAVQGDPSSTSWGQPLDADAPAPGGDVLALSAYGHALYVGGDFTSLGTLPQQGFAAIPLADDAGTGTIDCTPRIQLSGSGAFADQPLGSASAPHTFSVANVGNVNVVIPPAGVGLAGTDSGEYLESADGCSGQTLAPGGSCTVQVSFAPNTAGPHDGASLQITDNAPGSPQALPLTGTGIAPPVTRAPRKVLPVLSGLHQSHRRWREPPRPGHGKRRRRAVGSRIPIGTTLSFRLSEPARITLVFTQRVTGRVRRHRCVAVTRRNRHHAKCALTVTAGTLTVAGHAGRNVLAFDGRISRRRKLKPGDYTVWIFAAAAGSASAPHALSFTIVP